MAFNNPKPRESSTGKPDRGGMDTLIRAEKMTQIAFILPAAVLVGWLGGAGLDKWLHTGWLYIAGILLGVVAGFVQIFRLISVAGNAVDSAGDSAEAATNRGGPADGRPDRER